jgi:hypothetical protein
LLRRVSEVDSDTCPAKKAITVAYDTVRGARWRQTGL